MMTGDITINKDGYQVQKYVGGSPYLHRLCSMFSGYKQAKKVHTHVCEQASTNGHWVDYAEIYFLEEVTIWEVNELDLSVDDDYIGV